MNKRQRYHQDCFFSVLAMALLGAAVVIPAGLGLLWLLQELGLWKALVRPFLPFLEAFLRLLVTL